MFGYDAGVLGGVQETAPFRDAIGNPPGTYIIPLIASSYTLACWVSSTLYMFIGHPLGRRRTILFVHSGTRPDVRTDWTYLAWEMLT